jgi:branched-chain amino acid transport system ATP-binding protein
MLEIDQVHAGYVTGEVLQGVSLAVADGEVVALLGRNGMGKSTLLRAVCQLRPPILTGGEIRLDGRLLAGRESHQVARLGVGFVPQGRRIFGSLTVEENLRVVARAGARPKSDGWTVGRVFDLFPRLGERRRQGAATLSGGEQQMLAIGRALVTNPRVLVMDEPSEGLAPSVIATILDCLLDLKRAGHAVLLAEQNVDLALAVADRTSILGDGGRIAWAGGPADLRAKPAILHELIGL